MARNLEANIRPFELYIRELVEISAKLNLDNEAELIAEMALFYPLVVDVGIEGRFPNTVLVLTLRSVTREEYRKKEPIWEDRDGRPVDASSSRAVRDMMRDPILHAGQIHSKATIGTA